MKEQLKKIFIIFSILLVPLCVKALGVEITRDTPLIDTSALNTLKIFYGNDDVPLDFVTFKVYKVATVSSTFYFTLENEFSQYPVICNGLRTVDEWRDLAMTLDGYATRDKIKPLFQGITDEFGFLQINDLASGLYLVVGEKKEIGIATYIPESFLVSLPDLNPDNTWNNEVSVVPKFERYSDKLRLIEKKVIKVWDDEGYENLRPKEIALQLLRDGELYEEIVLNEENQWSYVFKELDNAYTYKVVEKGTKGYTVSINRDGSIYTITNKYIVPPPPEPEPPEPEPPLPETGQLWWPVPFLGIVGLMFIILGFIFDGKKKDKNEKK